MENQNKFAVQGHNVTGGGMNVFIPAAKNDSVSVYMNDTQSVALFFIYAKGSESEAQ